MTTLVSTVIGEKHHPDAWWAIEPDNPSPYREDVFARLEQHARIMFGPDCTVLERWSRTFEDRVNACVTVLYEIDEREGQP